MSASKREQQKRVVFDSDDSSASDSEGTGRSGDALAREMAAAVERERRKNPHAETGRAKAPRTHPLAPASVAPAAATAAAPVAAPKAKKMDLFDSSSSSDDEQESGGNAAEVKTPKAVAVPVSSSSHGAASKVAHVHGLSFRAVKKGNAGEDNAEEVKTKQLDDDAEADEEGGEEGSSVLRINKAFATRYEEQKRKQELHTLAEKYKGKLGRVAAMGQSDEDADEEDDEDDAEEDDDAVLLTRENGLSFAKALLAVRKATVPLPETPSAAAPALLPKEELLKDRFFPPAEEQIKANTDIFEQYVDRKRHGDGEQRRFTLADEYARAVRATADSEDAVVDDAAEGGERDGLRKLRPQNAAEAQLRAAFLRDVADSADTFEVVRGAKSNTAAAVESTKSDEEEDENDGEGRMTRQLQAAREEERRLLEEAFAVGSSSAASSKKRAAAKSEEEGKEAEGQSAAGADDNDAFLRDFFVQELWRPGASAKQKRSKKSKHGEETAEHAASEDDDNDEDDEDGNGGSYYDRLAQLAREEEDEAFFNDAEVWEREYQEKKYRHQEAEEAEANGGADAAHVQTFPRPIGEAAVGLLRKPDTARKDARQRRRERAEAAHAQQVEELKRLKHLKRKEIEDQRALIASVAGLTVGRRHGASRGAFDDGDAEEEAELAKLKAVWSDKDLDAPFDPAEFDKKMAQLFDNDYYDEKNVDEDEVAFFDEELDKEGGDGGADEDDAVKAGAAPALFAAESLEDAQALLPRSRSNKKEKKAEKFFDDDTFGPADGAGDALTLLYPSEALQELEKERQQLNDLLASSQQQQGNSAEAESNAELLARLQASLKKKEEEYYQLHRDAAAESAGGGLPFRYREVAPEDFTLSVEEILALDDRQLNMIAPMNCYAAYLDKDSNERDRRRIERRRQKGFREVASDRTSRRYGDVGSTAVLNPDEVKEEDGVAIAEKLAKRLRDEGEDPEAPLEVPSARPHRGGAFKGPRVEGGRGRGSRGGHDSRGRGVFRGRGAAASPSTFRGRGGASGAAAAAGAPRGGRGGGRGGSRGDGGRGGSFRRGY